VIVDRELDMRQKNGKPLSVLLTVHPRYNMDGTVVGYEGIVSRRKKLLKEVQEAHDFLRSIIQNSPNAIVGTDLDGQIILWNRGAEEILGYRAKDVIGKMNMSALFPEGKGEEMLDFLRREGGRLTGYPTIYVRQNGEGVEGSLSTSIVADASGKEVAIVGIFVDLKERIEMERKLRQTQDQLLQSEKLASLGKLSATIAHEINNPLAAVLTYIRLLAKLMARGQLTPERMGDVQKYLGIMESETARCGEIVKNLLAFSRQSSVRMGPCRVEDILEKTILLVAHDLEAMMAGGGVISVRAARSEDGRTIEIAISDTGCGISEEDLKTIFEPFFTTKGEGKGVGLGLSIAYGIITRHQGSIDVASEPGRGSTFTIRLPAA
jgi:PAS domain S-box-containing protein